MVVRDIEVEDGLDPLLSRDRRERLSSGSFEDSHWITLLVHDIPNRRYTLGGFHNHRLQVMHDSLRPNVSFHHDGHVIRGHVARQQTPVAICAALHPGGQNSLTAVSIHTIRRLVHPLPLRPDPLRIPFDQTAPGQIMLSIDRTGFIAVQVAAVTSEPNQVSHGL